MYIGLSLDTAVLISRPFEEHSVEIEAIHSASVSMLRLMEENKEREN